MTTTAGILTARLPAETGSGHELLLLDGGGHCLAAMARDTIALGSKRLLRGPPGAYLFLRALVLSICERDHGAFQERIERGCRKRRRGLRADAPF